MNNRNQFLAAQVVIIAMIGVGSLRGDDELGRRATWSPATYSGVKAVIDTWLEEEQIDPITRLKVDALWGPGTDTLQGTELIDRFAITVAVVHPELEGLARLRQRSAGMAEPPLFPILDDPALSPLVRDNMRLVYGRWLAQNDFFDEAAEQLSQLSTDQVLDSSTLLFYQAVAAQRLLKKEECLEALEKLLENEDDIPLRFRRIAAMMVADLRPLEQDSLDEIARLMDDIQRRQRLYRSGKRVRDEEDDVLEKLNKLIDELEKQAQSQAQAASSSNSSDASKPAEDSFLPTGGRPPGDVTQRSQEPGENWGDLPPKDQAEAMAELEEGLPPHYRKIIIEYLKRLAKEELDQ